MVALLVEEGVAAETLITGEVVRALRLLLLFRRFAAAVRLFVAVLTVIASRRCVFDIVDNDDHNTLLLVSCGVGPGVLVQMSENVDVRAFLDFHLFDALAHAVEGLDGYIQPAGVILRFAVINLVAYAEAHNFIIVEETERRVFAVFLGNDYICCYYFEHTVTPLQDFSLPNKIYLFQPELLGKETDINKKCLSAPTSDRHCIL